MNDLSELAIKADKMFQLREQRYALNRQADKIKEDEDALETEIINGLLENNSRGVAGQLVQLTLDSIPTATITNAMEFWKHVISTGDTDLVQQRLSPKAVTARWEAGETIPGVDAVAVRKLRTHKL